MMSPETGAAFVLLACCGLACFLLGSAWGLVAVSTLGLLLTGRYTHVRAQGPGGLLFEAHNPEQTEDEEHGSTAPTLDE
jgi:hypothetical protein